MEYRREGTAAFKIVLQSIQSACTVVEKKRLFKHKYAGAGQLICVKVKPFTTTYHH